MTARYVATINVPGYLPMDDDPPVFDTAGDAWAWLAYLRVSDEENESPTWRELHTLAESDEAGVGTVYGPTPGYEGDHDLGLAYSVSIVEDDES